MESAGGEGGGCGVLWRLDGLGTLGRGQVRSLSATGQNSRIFSYRYHCRCADRPAGVMTEGSSLGSSNEAPSFSRLCCSSMVSSVLSFVYTTPT